MEENKVALAECKECSKKVSTLAKTCPNCGVDDPYEPESLVSSVMSTLVGIGVAVGLIVWCAHMGKDNGDVQAVKKPKPDVPLATKIANMPSVCKLLIETTIVSQFNGNIMKWGKKGAWRKGRYNYASYRVTFAVQGTEIAGINRFKILCCIDRQTERFGIWSITDLSNNHTQAVSGKSSCRS